MLRKGFAERVFNENRGPKIAKNFTTKSSLNKKLYKLAEKSIEMHRILLGITEHIIREENRRHGTFLMKNDVSHLILKTLHYSSEILVFMFYYTVVHFTGVFVLNLDRFFCFAVLII